MDSSYSIRTQRPVYTARDPVAVRGAVATELDTSKTVGAAGREAGQQQRDPREDHPHQGEPTLCRQGRNAGALGAP